MVVDLKESRKKIDEIDKEIAKLFEERMEVASDVALYKRSTGKKVFDPAREDSKIESLCGLTQNEFNKKGIEDLFRQIMSISRKYQYQVLGASINDIPFRQVDQLDVNPDTRIAFFGDRGAYTEQAMEEFFGTEISSFNKTTFKEVVEAVANGDAKFGVVPIENSSTGGITDTYDLLLDYDVTIVAEHVVRVDQALLGLPGTKIEELQRVYSHPQGLLQCKKYLGEHSYIRPEEFSSTAGAARKVAEEQDKTQGAIASTRAAKVFQLEVLQEKINSESENYTRFIIISNQKIFLASANKISLSFEIQHQAGALYNILSNFYYNKLNLTKIESRPILGSKWEYRFFVDIEGNLNDPEVENALASVQELSMKTQVLGNIATKEMDAV